MEYDYDKYLEKVKNKKPKYIIDGYKNGCGINIINSYERTKINYLVTILRKHAERDISPQCLFSFNGIDYMSNFIQNQKAINEILNHLNVKFETEIDELDISFEVFY